MIDSEKGRFVAVLTGLAEYYQRPMSPVIIGLYWEGLKRFDLKAIEDAAGRHIAQGDAGQFMPKVADLAKLIEGSGSDSALMAWAKVTKACKSVGAYSTVAFDDPLIHAAIADMGGWIAICHIEEGEFPFKEKEFVAKYRAYRNRSDLNYPAKLLGMFDTQNSARGFRDETPVALIGDQRAAQKVLENGGKGGWLQVAYVAGEGVKSLPRAA